MNCQIFTKTLCKRGKSLYKVPYWALSLASFPFLTSFRSDQHMALHWLVECKMIRVSLQHSNECSLLHSLRMISLVIREWVPLLSLKVSFRINQSFALLLWFKLVRKTGWPIFRIFMQNINCDILISWSCRPEPHGNNESLSAWNASYSRAALLSL